MQAEAGLASERARVRTQRLELEEERARVLAMRDEAAESTAANAMKVAQIERLQSDKADAEARAAAHASEARRLRGQSSRLLQEFEALHADVFGCTVSLCGTEVAGPGGGSAVAVHRPCDDVAVDGEGLARLRRRVREALRAHAVAEERRRALQEEMDAMRQELAGTKSAAAAAQAEVGALWQAVRDAQELLVEAREGRERALSQAEDCRRALTHAEGELREAEGAAATARCARDRAIAACVDPQGGRHVSPPCRAAAWTEAPELGAASSQVHMGSSVSSSAVIAQRLEQLEAEERELQAEMAEFRDKVARQQAQLHRSVRGGLWSTPQEHAARLNYAGMAGMPVVASPMRCAGVGRPVSPALAHSGYVYNATMCPPTSAGLMARSEGVRVDEPLGADPGRDVAAGQACLGSVWAAPAVRGPAVQEGLFAEHGRGLQQRSQSLRTTVEDVTHEYAGDAAAAAGMRQSTSSEEPLTVLPCLDRRSFAGTQSAAIVPPSAQQCDRGDLADAHTTSHASAPRGASDSHAHDFSHSLDAGSGQNGNVASQGGFFHSRSRIEKVEARTVFLPSTSDTAQVDVIGECTSALPVAAVIGAGMSGSSTSFSRCEDGQRTLLHTSSLTSKIIALAPRDTDDDEPSLPTDQHCAAHDDREMQQEDTCSTSTTGDKAADFSFPPNETHATDQGSTDVIEPLDRAVEAPIQPLAPEAFEQAMAPNHEARLECIVRESSIMESLKRDILSETAFLDETALAASCGVGASSDELAQEDQYCSGTAVNTVLKISPSKAEQSTSEVEEDGGRVNKQSEFGTAADPRECSSASMV